MVMSSRISRRKNARYLIPAWLMCMTDMLQGPVNFGTAAGIRGMGFTWQAAGKTGTSHDAWFAGYTTNLLCIVWIGYDDYSDLKLSGAATAAPIWAQFMKKALNLPQYKDPKWFSTPPGVVTLKARQGYEPDRHAGVSRRLLRRLHRRNGADRHLRARDRQPEPYPEDLRDW